MDTTIWVILVILALIGGGVAGFFISRATFQSHIEKNPPIDEKIIRVMYMQMGITPSQKRINQVLQQVKQNAGKKDKKNETKKKLSGKKEQKVETKKSLFGRKK